MATSSRDRSTSTHFGVKFEAWQVHIDQATVRGHILNRTHRALGKIGAILMRAARKKIKSRIVTAGMRARLRKAREHGDQAAARRILATIQTRQSTVSQPGQPPLAHVPDHPVASIRAIYFAVLPPLVMVGPVLANQVTWRNSHRSSVPELLEKGGEALIQEERIRFRNGGKGPWLRRDLRLNARATREYRTRRAHYQPRPFMRPTLAENQGKIRDVIASVFQSKAA
jgi:hypothetical protein